MYETIFNVAPAVVGRKSEDTKTSEVKARGQCAQPRPPRLRDDNAVFGCYDDRVSDKEFFSQESLSEFRIVTPTAAERQSVGISDFPDTWCAVRLARHFYDVEEYGPSRAFVFLLKLNDVPRLNAADDWDIHDLWDFLLSQGHKLGTSAWAWGDAEEYHRTWGGSGE